MSEGALHEVFENAEETSSAAFEEGLARLSDAVEQAAGCEQSWSDRVRSGLVALLGFLDDEPAWGRLLLFDAPVDGAAAFRCEQRVLGVLTVLMDDGSPQAIAETMCEPQLTAEFVIGGVFSVIRARMIDTNRGRLVELAPSLMSFIVRPYLGQAAAEAELASGHPGEDDAPSRAAEPSTPPPIPVTHRTTLVLRAIARAPRSSNREIAAAAGLGDEGQASHLLRRLAHRGLIEKVTPRNGSRRENAWLLTTCGRRVMALLDPHTAAASPAPTSAKVAEAA